MARKSAPKPESDYSWVDTEVKFKRDITDEHLRRAAGLHELPTHLWRGPGHSPDKDSIKEKIFCRAKSCALNPRCYAHLGISEALSLDKEAYIDSKRQQSTGPRDGPVGLRNLGATCYVRHTHLIPCSYLLTYRLMHFSKYGTTMSPFAMASIPLSMLLYVEPHSRG